MVVFRRSSRLKISSTKGFPEAIALASANKITTPKVCPNESEDLSILEMIWDTNTINDIWLVSIQACCFQKMLGKMFLR